MTPTKTAAHLSALYAGKTAATLTAQYGRPYEGNTLTLSTRAALSLSLRTREIDHESGRMICTLSSDEALLQDYGLVAELPTAPGGSQASDAVRFALRKIGRYLAPGHADGQVDVSLIVWEPGQTAWDYLSPILQKTGLRLFCDERRRWRLVEATHNTPGGISISAAVNATEGVDQITLESSWCDAVVVKYQWQDSNGNSHVRYDTAASRVRPTKTMTVTHDAVYPGPGAAALLLNRALGRGRTMPVSAVSNYEARPGNPITVNLPNTPPQVGHVASVAWAFPDDEMRITTRDLTEN